MKSGAAFVMKINDLDNLVPLFAAFRVKSMLAQKPGAEESGDTQSVEVETAEQEGGEIEQSEARTETMQAGSGT